MTELEKNQNLNKEQGCQKPNKANITTLIFPYTDSVGKQRLSTTNLNN